MTDIFWNMLRNITKDPLIRTNIPKSIRAKKNSIKQTRMMTLFQASISKFPCKNAKKMLKR